MINYSQSLSGKCLNITVVGFTLSLLIFTGAFLLLVNNMNSSFLEEWKKRKQYYSDMHQGSTSIENIENFDSV